jgi:hypothetical protein
MPEKELPEEFMKPLLSPSNSSLSSNSDVILINAHYVRNSRSTSISSCNSTNDDSFETNAANVNFNNSRNSRRHNEDVEEEEDEEEEKYEPIKLPTEPTLEELLVISYPQLVTHSHTHLKVSFLFSATSDWQRRHLIRGASEIAHNILSD